MKVIGLINLDYANAAWHIFRALRAYGITAYLINFRLRISQPWANWKYDIRLWEEKEFALELISQADIIHIFESGDTIEELQKLPTINALIKNKPKIVSVNTIEYYYTSGQAVFNKRIRPYGDFFTALTINYPIKELHLGLQPLPEEEYEIRKDYSLKNKEIVVGGAPGYEWAYKNKKFPELKERIKNMDILMEQTQETVKKHMTENHDIFTHGIGISGAYGYSLLQAAMFGIPCFSHIKDRDKNKLLINGKFPILEIGSKAEKLNNVLELLSDKDKRKEHGQLMAKWARKYHNYEACYKTYKKFYEQLIIRR